MSARGAAGIPTLPRRPRDAHKGDFGRVLVVAGSRRMPGAAYLAGQAAMRAGAGLTTIAVPDAALPMVGAKVTVQTLLDLPSTRAGTLAPKAEKLLIAAAAEFDAVALGPGLGADSATARTIRRVVCEITKPLVLDADGLNAFASANALADLARRKAPTVLTPHPGEAARLLGSTTAKIQADRVGAARTLAQRARAFVILKGAESCISDGTKVHINRTGNPGMATGGSGDVLTGIVAAFLARGLPPWDAAVLAAHVHGRAGDLAARDGGEDGLLATDLLEFLRRAVAERVQRRP
ncbi:MAG: NAD(P)H-hydrate dehydratase [Planctomycetes bacterium]|nr:NAD(P)H-hydrate dehydratase [Planctomycetota bacterium]